MRRREARAQARLVGETGMIGAYLARSEALSREADEFIRAIGLIDILEPFGEVEFLGSYPLKVMNRRDIDTHVATTSPGLGPVMTLMSRLHEANFTRFWVYNNLSKACAADPRHIVCESVHRFYDDAVPLEEQWTVAVSFSKPEDKEECFRLQRRFAAAFEARPSLREDVIRLKFQLKEAGHPLPGKDVYAAVIDRGFRDVQEFVNQGGRDDQPEVD
jgi:hypothetical protein